MWDFDPTYDRSGSSRPVDTPTAVAACPLRAESGRVGRHLAKSALCQKRTSEGLADLVVSI
jgi:hypothetical protein